MKGEGNHWVLLDSERPRALPAGGVSLSFTFHEMLMELERMGRNVHLIKLYYEDGREVEPEALSKAIAEHPADRIMWIGQDAWKYFDVIRMFDCAKINMWYDDPIIRLFQRDDIVAMMRGTVLDPSWRINVWDHSWGVDLARRVPGLSPGFCNLAASPKMFFPSQRKLSDEIVFIGSLHSPLLIWQTVNTLPEIFQEVIRRCDDFIKGHKGILPPWNVVIRHVLECMTEGDRQIYKQMVELRNGSVHFVHDVLWMLLKNEARVRLLKQCLKAGKVFMLTETAQRSHASGDEIHGMVGEWDRSKLAITNTNGVPIQSLGHLYHYGAIHVQAVDPQSITEGIPYRMFQTGLSARPLVTDWRKGWDAHFNRDDYFIYNEYEEIPDVISAALKNKDEMAERASRSHYNCMERHTWETRLKQIDFEASLVKGSMEVCA